jgi:hypothetical protein
MDLIVDVTDGACSAEQLDDLTRALLHDLQTAGMVEATRREEEASAGAKGDPVTIGMLLVAVLPTVLPQVIVFLNEVAGKAPQRRIRIKGKKGAEIEFTPNKPITLEEAIKIARKLDEGR